MESVVRILILGLSIGAIYSLIAIGLNLLWGTMRMLNIAHGGLMMLGAYAAYLFFTSMGVNPFISGLIAAVAMAAVGLIIFKVLFASNIRKAKSLEDLEGNSLLIFFGILILVQNVALLIWGGNIKGYSYLTESINLLETPLALNRLASALVAIVACLAFYMFLQRTLFGKAVRAVIQDKDATQLSGVDPNKIYMFCFGVAFGMAGLAGALISMLFSISPFMGLPYSMIAFVVIILGGLGNILGSLVGGLLLGVITTAGVTFTSPGYSFTIQYLLFILIIIFMPSGILGRRMQ